ncbi:MAG: allophanate hydrolase subunit 1 [Planctomycetota bacterium]
MKRARNESKRPQSDFLPPNGESLPDCTESLPTGIEAISWLADDALLLRVGDAKAANAVADALRAEGIWDEAVAGLDSVVVTFAPGNFTPDQAFEAFRTSLAKVRAPVSRKHQTMTLPIHYGGEFGPDLAGICRSLGITVDAFVAYHTSKAFRVELIGFTPGFAYVGGLDRRFEIARLATPRVWVEAGSIGLAAGFTGLYAMAGPGGWPLIGRTTATLFDPTSQKPFLVRAGDWIRFQAVDVECPC